MAIETSQVQGCRAKWSRDVYVSIVPQEEVNDVSMAMETGRVQGLSLIHISEPTRR